MPAQRAYPNQPGQPLSRAAEPAISYREFWTCPHCGHQQSLDTTDLTWTVRGPRDVYDRFLLKLRDTITEELWTISLNTKNRVIAECQVARGSLAEVSIRLADVFRDPIARSAAGLILLHQHPSGDPTPSPQDIHLCMETLTAAKVLDVDLLDFVIVGRSSYVSLRDAGHISFHRQIPAIADPGDVPMT